MLTRRNVSNEHGVRRSSTNTPYLHHFPFSLHLPLSSVLLLGIPSLIIPGLVPLLSQWLWSVLILLGKNLLDLWVEILRMSLTNVESSSELL